MKVHENLLSEICSYPCRWTDRQTGRWRDMMKLMVTFCNCFVNTTYRGVNMGLQVNQIEMKMLTQSRTRQRCTKHSTVSWSKFVVVKEFKYLEQY